MGGGPRRLALGTRINDDRCSLPGLAGLAIYRREEPTGTTIFDAAARCAAGLAAAPGLGPARRELAEREGFEPSKRG